MWVLGIGPKSVKCPQLLSCLSSPSKFASNSTLSQLVLLNQPTLRIDLYVAFARFFKILIFI